MYETSANVPAIPCWIIADAAALKKYGLGMVRMGTSNLKPYIDDGYLVEAPRITAFAREDRRRCQGARSHRRRHKSVRRVRYRRAVRPGGPPTTIGSMATPPTSPIRTSARL